MKSEIPQQLMDGFQSNFDHDLFMVSKRSQMSFSLVMLGGWHFNILSTRVKLNIYCGHFICYMKT